MIREASRTDALRHVIPLLGASIRRDWKIAISYRLAFVTQLLGSVTSLVLVYFLGHLVDTTKAIKTGPGTSLALGYFPFAVVGLAMLNIVQTSVRTVSNQVRTDQVSGTLEALLAMPPPPWLTVMASVAFQFIYTLIMSTVTLIIAVAFFGMRFHLTAISLLVAIAGIVIAVPLFVALGVAFASSVIAFKRGGSLTGFVITGFTLLGGVYYPTRVLSPPLRVVSDLLPFTWLLDIVRGGLLEAQTTWPQLISLAVATALLVPASFTVFSRAVDRARRAGTLHQF